MLRRAFYVAAGVNVAWALVSSGAVNQSVSMGAINWVYFAPITAVVLLRWFGRSRASDCFLEGGEIRIEGGKYDAFRIAMSSVDMGASRLGDDGVLTLDLGSGVRVPVAFAADDDERRSMRALLDTIASKRRTGPHRQRPSLPAPPPTTASRS